jgi:sec-independent protein translocase protein TatB
MFDMGWSELLVIGVVALIVVGPKDLPILFRRVGQFVGKAKGMAREFSSAMNQAADESGMAEVKKSLQAAANPVQTGLDSVKSAATDFAKYDPDSETGKLAADREAARKKIHDATLKRAEERRAAEQAAAQAAADEQAMSETGDNSTPAPDTQSAKDTK